MTTRDPAEIRRWRREPVLGLQFPRIVGYVYNDPNAFWDNGEMGVFDDLESFEDKGFYFLFKQSGSIFYYKCMKEEEVKRG